MIVLSLLLPAALAAYCIYRAARSPIFLLGVPFLRVHPYEEHQAVMGPW